MLENGKAKAVEKACGLEKVRDCNEFEKGLRQKNKEADNQLVIRRVLNA